MNSTTEERQGEQLRQKLHSSTDHEILTELAHIREHGAQLYAVEPIAELLFGPHDEPVKQGVAELLADLRLPEANAVLARCVERYSQHSEVWRLVSVCWMGRLDFVDYAPLFIDLLRHGGQNTGLEAYTVLQELLPRLSPTQRTECAQLLQQADNERPALVNAGLMQSLADELMG